MNCERESWILSLDEIAAILSLVGRERFVGLAEMQAQPLQTQDILNACCRLLQDRMMTQVDGKYRLSRALSEVVEPVCMAKTVLVLIPGRMRWERVLFYVGRGVTVLERSIRGLALTRLDREALAEELWERVELHPEDEPPDEIPLPPAASTLREELMVDASFLMEAMDPDTGSRRGWIRVRRQALQDNWLEWTQDGRVCQTFLSRRALADALSSILRGDIE